MDRRKALTEASSNNSRLAGEEGKVRDLEDCLVAIDIVLHSSKGHRRVSFLRVEWRLIHMRQREVVQREEGVGQAQRVALT